MGARPFEIRGVFAEQRVHLAYQGADLGRLRFRHLYALAGAHLGEVPAQAFQRSQAEAHLRDEAGEEAEAEHGEDQRQGKARLPDGAAQGRHGRGGDDRRRADPRRIRKGENAQDHRVAPGIDGVGRAGAVAASTPAIRAVVFGDGEVAAFQGAGSKDRVALPDLPGPARPVAVEGRAVEVAPEGEAAVAAPLEARCDGDDLTVEAAVEAGRARSGAG